MKKLIKKLQPKVKKVVDNSKVKKGKFPLPLNHTAGKSVCIFETPKSEKCFSKGIHRFEEIKLLKELCLRNGNKVFGGSNTIGSVEFHIQKSCRLIHSKEDKKIVVYKRDGSVSNSLSQVYEVL